MDRGARLAVACSCLVLAACGSPALPKGIADRDWWELIARLSEPHREFRLSENLVSNEAGYAERVRWLRPSGGVYIGVGPEQNFSYIAALQPEIAFIVDIRRENLLLHLMYKALFEVSTDRAEFLARLFSRAAPSQLPSAATIDDLLSTIAGADPVTADLEQNVARVRGRLLETRGIPLSGEDLAWIDRTMGVFQRLGPAIQFWDTTSVDLDAPTYRALMVARDSTGAQRSFLASDAAFRFIKDLHTRNLIVPVVGNFAGPRTLRRIGDYAREHGAVVQAFYASNVGVYLSPPQTRDFCDNLATLPVASRGAFVEGNRMRTIGRALLTCAGKR
jgi:hypothetical protein